MRAINTLAAIALILGVLSPAHGMRPGPLPTFQLTGLNGQAIPSNKLATAPRWLILYIQADCRSCETVLQLLKQKNQHPNLPGKLVIVGAMSLPEVKALAQKYTGLTSAQWTIDTSRTVFKQLKLPGTPTVLGMDRTTMMWSLQGTGGDPNQFTKILESWTK